MQSPPVAVVFFLAGEMGEEKQENLPRLFHDTSVHSRINSWNKGGSSAPAKKSLLPYHGMLHMQEIQGHEEGYGRPKEGTKTEYRGKQAGVRISGEIIELCHVIQGLGLQVSDTQFAIKFGTLFEAYTKISNKLVGMLIRARKQGLVKFDGEMLFQGRDDNVVIRLLKMPEELEDDVERRKEELQSHEKRDT